MSPELFLSIWIATIIICYGAIIAIAGFMSMRGTVGGIIGLNDRDGTVVEPGTDKREV